MTDFDLTIDAAFADDPANTMTPSHWTVPVEEVEALLQGRVGRAVGEIDNISGDGAVHGVNFRARGLADVWTVDEVDANWSVSSETALLASTKQALDLSPMPGGSLRFYAKAPCKLCVLFHARAIGIGALPQGFQFAYMLAGGPVPVRNRLGGATLPTTSTDQSITMAWETTLVAAGWQTIHHPVVEWADSTHIIFGETHMMVVAIYQ